ncbi:hypothetical protein GTA08_BOTSDO13127 [Botryosphaeria dothidea]|uniref:Aminoglycoside phosphotransferase domain-containing protein n=1 Tax=Botryosphaeria dothidea TaxID=55169 RepID=A0A8H4NDN4_9PEZI|nr:hypothetical protein GTA08_BOTSDO13127 [Botryosphaeria dothidea]
MRLLREKTTIPVPKVHGWGFSDVNPFGLGPFIIMDYIEGHPLGTLWEDPNQDRLLRPNIDEQDLRKVYRQISRHLLELSRLQFTEIGSLDIGDDGTPLVRRPPLTLKMQEIEAHGGVKVGDSKTPFSSWTEYFTYVADQDLKHLNEQPNSVDDAQDARDKFVFRRLFRDAIPSFVSNEHGKEGSRLLNDDFRFGNILVKSQTDLSIVAVLDWEWTYTAPY